jgi:colicin import membrane protein
MNASLAARDAPRPPDGLALGAVLALLVHLLLVVAIALGVNWRTREDQGVVAELWSALPQVAAPRAVAPPPTPQRVEPPRPAPPTPAPDTARAADAQIAIEKARREAEAREAERREQERLRLAREEAEREKARQQAAADEAKRELAAKEAEAQRKKQLAEKERQSEAALAAQREAFLKRMQGQANATGEEGSTGSAARTSGPSASYAGRIRARIKPNIVFTDDIAGNPIATVEVRCAPDGTIVSRKLVKSSGNGAWDDAVLRAIDKTEILPRDSDGSMPSPMQIAFRPRD